MHSSVVIYESQIFLLYIKDLLDYIPDNSFDFSPTDWTPHTLIPILLGALIAANLMAKPSMDETGILGPIQAEHAKIRLPVAFLVMIAELAVEIM